MSDDRGSDSKEMSRWQGRIEATIDAIRHDMEGRDKRYTERAEAQDRAVQAALAAQKELVATAHAASEKAVEKSEQTAEKWRQSANEWRGAMSDRDRELPSRREMTAEIARLEAMITPLTRSDTRQEGRREGISASVALLISALLIAIAIVSVVLATH